MRVTAERLTGEEEHLLREQAIGEGFVGEAHTGPALGLGEGVAREFRALGGEPGGVDERAREEVGQREGDAGDLVGASRVDAGARGREEADEAGEVLAGVVPGAEVVGVGEEGEQRLERRVVATEAPPQLDRGEPKEVAVGRGEVAGGERGQPVDPRHPPGRAPGGHPGDVGQDVGGVSTRPRSASAVNRASSARNVDLNA